MPPIRLCSVLGYEGRANDVVFCPPALRSDEHSTVIYFGGDVQDFPEAMKSHRDNKNYIKWNLENMAAMLNISFPRSHIVVVRPSRMEYKTFSCYDNFVPSNNAGLPDHTPTHHALQHLERLLQGVTNTIKNMPSAELKEMLSSSLANQQFYMDVDILQVSIDSNNAKAETSPMETPTSLLQKELENTRNLTVTTSLANSYSESHSQNSAPDHHVTITSTGKHANLEEANNSQSANSPAGVIQTTVPSSVNQPSVVLSSQCQSAIVVNPQSINTDQQSSTDTKKGENNYNILWWRDSLALDKANLTIVGFSKGCVVLNQLIYEFHYLKTLTPDDSTMMRLVSRITEMFWLDGGHAGGKNSWITSRSLLETLTRLGIKIWIHVTPYQVQDDRRNWIRREERAFSSLLERLGARVSRTLHFDGAAPSLYMHFDLLNVFRSPEHLLTQNTPPNDK